MMHLSIPQCTRPTGRLWSLAGVDKVSDSDDYVSVWQIPSWSEHSEHWAEMLKTCFLLCLLLTRSYDVKRGRMTSKLFGRYKKYIPHKTWNFDIKTPMVAEKLLFVWWNILFWATLYMRDVFRWLPARQGIQNRMHGCIGLVMLAGPCFSERGDYVIL